MNQKDLLEEEKVVRKRAVRRGGGDDISEFTENVISDAEI